MASELWQNALTATLLEPTDLRFRNDYVPVDPARLPVVDWAMVQPMELPQWLAKVASGHMRGKITTAEAWHGYTAVNDADWWTLVMPPEAVSISTGVPKSRVTVSEFPISLTPVLAALRHVNTEPLSIKPEGLDTAADSIWTLLHVQYPELLWEDPDDEFRSPEWQDSVQQYEEEISRQLVTAIAKVPLSRIYADANAVTKSFEAWLAGLSVTGLGPWRSLAKPGEPLREFDTPYGRIVFGTSGPDRYTGSYAFILDPGGDDIYELAYDSAHPSRVILDLGGDDSYRGLTNAAIAGGFWGTQILYDAEGNDTYQAQSLDLGAGMFGLGVLIDVSGRDIYAGDTFVEGAGSFGVGMLIDSTGNDTYNAALFGQGFGFIRGAGVIDDGTGNDHYNAGGKYKDVLRYTDRYLSLSQGFAYGIRPFLSGGIGVIFDRGGNDDYNCDIFGQGASYWWGIGGLWDKSGNDRYLGFQYAQGAATHMTAAVLVDEAGDDIYFSKGVSQGCGHDLAPGLLWDLAGNDVYTGYDLSQGAGSANGLGVLFDATGDDRYYVKSSKNTQGYGNPRRDYGSIGWFLDGGGNDHYDGPGADSTWWRIESKWGIGIDFDTMQVTR